MEPSPGRKPVWPKVKAALAVVLLGLILLYLANHAPELEKLPRLAATTWAGIIGITVLGTLLSTLGVQSLLAAVGVGTGFLEMYWLHSAAYLLNLLPGRLGTVLRAHYLKKHHALSYTRFGLFALYLSLLTSLMTALVGLVCLVAVYGLDATAHRVSALLLGGSVLLTTALLFLPLPVPAWRGRLAGLVTRLLAARGELLGRWRTLRAPALWVFVVYLLGVWRLGLIYQGLGLEARPEGLLLLGALGQLTLLVNVTPGGLGVRELLLGMGGTVLGVPMEAGLLAALIERAVGLGWALLVGFPCAVWALRRQGGEGVSGESDPELDEAAPEPPGPALP